MSGREWRNGAVASVSSASALNQRAVRRGGVWIYLDREGYCIDEYALSVRPLLVLDPDDGEQMQRILDHLESESGWTVDDEFGSDEQTSLGAMAAAITSLLERPKLQEPAGHYAVVEDATAVEWVRADQSGPYRWCGLGVTHSDGKPVWLPWDEIGAVRVLSEGVVQP